ncbi:hypothetical protein [Haladaptatus caseinilyticus]|uniref:hypothetical protein n=1 Tax=Haladaptatus caseinilyticus TaxID=2993314 RepID=UPI00224B7928|nr:hypothetical protein [Haladaptatus caseinilyticus]
MYPQLQESDAFLEFATLGTPNTGLLPQFWAYGTDRDQLAEQLSTTPALRSISKQVACTDRVRYDVKWNNSAGAIVDLECLRTLLRDLEATVLFGRITPAEWVIVCQFPTQEAVIHCYNKCEYPDSQLSQYTNLDLKEHYPENQ